MIETLVKKSNSLLSSSTLNSKTFSPQKKEYFRNVLKYLDEHIYFNYLKLTDPTYGLDFESQLFAHI